VDSNAPANTRGFEFSAAHVAPQRRVREAGVAFRLRVADPFLLYWLLKQLYLLLLVFLRLPDA
jgi:hypothetical protein